MRERVDRSAPPKTGKAILTALYPALLCAAGEGIFSTCFKLVEVLGMSASRNIFLVLFNLVALLGIASIVVARGGSHPQRKEYQSGLVSGLGFVGAGFFGILAILEIPAIMYFPVLAASVLVLTVLCSSLIWQEHTSPVQRWGIGLSVVAIMLVSLG
jgi:drug/metabolite transporter (DMT)-like permease